MNKFTLTSILALTSCAILLLLIVNSNYFNLSNPHGALLITVYQYGIAVASFLVIYQSSLTKKQTAINLMLLALMVELLLHIIFIGVLLYIDQKNAPSNSVYFLITFILFKAIEIYILYKKISET